MSHRPKSRPIRKNKQWTSKEVQQLKKLAKGNTPTGLIADALGRTKNAIQSKASEKKVTLKPVNKSPYNRRKKGR